MVRLKRGDQGWTDFQGRKNTPLKRKEVFMEIQHIKSAYGAISYDPSSQKGKKQDQAKPPLNSGEVVAFSETSLNMQKIKEAVYKAPEIRIPIVEEIKKKIENNEYPIDLKAKSALDRLINDQIV